MLSTPEEDRFLRNIRGLMPFMGLPHDFQMDNPKNWNHVCQNVLLNTASSSLSMCCRARVSVTTSFHIVRFRQVI